MDRCKRFDSSRLVFPHPARSPVQLFANSDIVFGFVYSGATLFLPVFAERIGPPAPSSEPSLYDLTPLTGVKTETAYCF